MFTRTLTAAALAATLAAPAMAGSVSLTLSPSTPEQARLMRAGLAIYGIVQDIETNGHITQSGIANAAALTQRGRGHLGVIHQEGDSHDASLTQTGRGNAYGIFQFGEATSTEVVQTGRGQTGVTVQFGW